MNQGQGLGVSQARCDSLGGVCVQLGTLGAGNHYAEIQVVDEIYNDYAAKKMGVDRRGQVCVMIHSGSRGLGHQVATGELGGGASPQRTGPTSLTVPLTDALVAMEKAMKRDQISVNDRQLACARVSSPEGQDYLKGMAAAGNYAWVNRSSMTFLTRQVSGWGGNGWGRGRSSRPLSSRPSPRCSRPRPTTWTCT